MKEIYEKAELEVVIFTDSDIITGTSDIDPSDYNLGGLDG